MLGTARLNVRKTIGKLGIPSSVRNSGNDAWESEDDVRAENGCKWTAITAITCTMRVGVRETGMTSFDRFITLSAVNNLVTVNE